jgi:hypothetical protein
MCLGALALNLFGCNSTDQSTDSGACLDIPSLPTTPEISFRNDLMPIFGLSCIASSCHDQSAKKANLILGDPSACGPMGTSCFDDAAKWKYTFKTQPQDREALVQTVLTNLVGTPSATNPAVQRIAPGNPAGSFLLDKVTGEQSTKQYPGPCTNQDPSRPAGPCGSDMPLGVTGGFCSDSSDKVQAIAMWIQQGAKNN